MLEIRTEFQPYKLGELPMFIIFMKKGDIEFNTVIQAGEWMNDGDKVLEYLKCAFTNLIHMLYPEMSDPLYKMEKRLKELDEERLNTINAIEILKQNRKE